jgi:hypothetical protein
MAVAAMEKAYEAFCLATYTHRHSCPGAKCKSYKSSFVIGPAGRARIFGHYEEHVMGAPLWCVTLRFAQETGR